MREGEIMQVWISSPPLRPPSIPTPLRGLVAVVRDKAPPGGFSHWYRLTRER